MKKTILSFLAVIISYASFAIAPITGVTVVCKWDTVALHDATPGGTWASSDATIASVDAMGVVTGVSLGTATITYTASGIATTTVTVNFLPTITGITSMCSGIGTVYTNSLPGGVWASVPTTVGTINPTTGAYTAIAGGNDTIYYTTSPGCYTALINTVNLMPTITGTKIVSLGGTRTLTGTPSGGIWTSAATNVSVGSATGVVTGISAGTATVNYFNAGCPAMVTVTVTSTTGVNPGLGNEQGGAITISPNPATDNVNIAWNNIVPGTANVTLTDVTGRSLYQTTITMSANEGDKTIWIPSLEDGMYIIGVFSPQQNYKGKLQVQRQVH